MEKNRKKWEKNGKKWKKIEKNGKKWEKREKKGKKGKKREKNGNIWKNKEAFAWRMKWRRAGMGNIFCMRKIIMNSIY